MKIETQSAAVEILYAAIPYSDQIKDLNLSKAPNIYFTWRGTKFKLEIEFSRVDEVQGSMLAGSDLAILMTHLIKMEAVRRFVG